MGSPRLSPRQEDILTLIAADGAQQIDALARRYGLTTQSIRRDINVLCAQGLARRLHGGVDLPVIPQNSPVHARAGLQSAAKRRIGIRIADEIPNGSTVFLGIGTTVQATAEALREHSGLVVITNNLEVALTLGQSAGIELHLTGGMWRTDYRDVVGLDAIRYFEKFHATHSVVGAAGLSPATGALEFSHQDAQITSAIVENSRVRYLAADVTKWDRAAAVVRTAPFSSFSSFVTDRLPNDPAARDALAASGMQIVVCSEAG